MFVDGSNGLCQISEHFLVLEVELSIIVVNDPRKDRILGQIVMGAPCKHVNNIQIMNIGYLSSHPTVSDFRQLHLDDFFSLFS